MMNFKDILEEKMTAKEDIEPRAKVEMNTVDPAHLAFLLGQIPVRRFQITPPKAFRPDRRMTKSNPIRCKRPDHLLNERQKAATVWFRENGQTLLPDFTADELKRAFRILARQLHPDAGGQTTSFIELKAHHAALRSAEQSHLEAAGAAP